MNRTIDPRDVAAHGRVDQRGEDLASGAAGVNLRIIQSILGHATPTTTAVYTHLTQQVRESVKAPINELMNGL